MSWLRENRLLQLVSVLWGELPESVRRELEPHIEAAGMGWAIHVTREHISDDDWLTPAQIATHLGLQESTIRNWPSRYGLTANRLGQYRWGDVQDIRQKQARRNAA